MVLGCFSFANDISFFLPWQINLSEPQFFEASLSGRSMDTLTDNIFDKKKKIKQDKLMLDFIQKFIEFILKCNKSLQS